MSNAFEKMEGKLNAAFHRHCYAIDCADCRYSQWQHHPFECRRQFEREWDAKKIKLNQSFKRSAK